MLLLRPLSPSTAQFLKDSVVDFEMLRGFLRRLLESFPLSAMNLSAFGPSARSWVLTTASFKITASRQKIYERCNVALTTTAHQPIS